LAAKIFRKFKNEITLLFSLAILNEQGLQLLWKQVDFPSKKAE